ncbi:hypothetical protein ACHAXN_012594, partial [Cyclotella atomus]
MFYDLSLGCYFLVRKAAYSNRKIDEAKKALGKVVEHASSLQIKLDAYELLRHILFYACAPKEMGQLLITMIGVLKSLGEYIRYENVASGEITTK